MATTGSAPLSLHRLEAHLWQAADLFRNKVSNQKDYILALLFFKRASDLYKEELDAALEELGDVPNASELARDPAFHVPDGHTWDDVHNTDEALQGQALNDALAVIGRANPKQLAGVFERGATSTRSAGTASTPIAVASGRASGVPVMSSQPLLIGCSDRGRSDEPTGPGGWARPNTASLFPLEPKTLASGGMIQLVSARQSTVHDCAKAIGA
jgi:hypothetical protein